MLSQFLWSAKSNRAQGVSVRRMPGDPTPWVSGPGKWARCYVRNKPTPAYRSWTGISSRTYDAGASQPAYAGATACQDWHDYQAFAEWYYAQPGADLNYEVEKDILNPGNKRYEPDSCGLVPKWLNKFFAFQYATNSSGFPGVSRDSKGTLWIARAQCSVLNEMACKTSQDFDTACAYYCEMKQSQARRAAELLEGSPVPEKYLDSLRNFTVMTYLRENTNGV
ncbi:hypothetical protein [Stutzerimonas stutzeri]|uniref:hypothetical protein n=1 Tax=Stutzerimonas stutzeri TaxID=316 RepID=UPI003B7D4896